MFHESDVNTDPCRSPICSHGYSSDTSTLKWSKFLSIHKNKPLPNDVPCLSSRLKDVWSYQNSQTTPTSFYTSTYLSAVIEYARNNLAFLAIYPESSDYISNILKIDF